MHAQGQALRAAPGCAVTIVAPVVDLPSRHPLLRLDAAVVRGLAGIVVARVAVNGGIRVVYPFLTVIAHGLGVSFGTIALMVASRSLAGLAGPLINQATSGRRQRHVMLLGLLVVAAGCLLIVASAGLPRPLRTVAVGTGFAATGLARALFELPMQTWVGVNVPVRMRGRALGLTELSWALSLAVTVPLAGVLISWMGWRGPFLLVVGLTVLGAAALAAGVDGGTGVATAPTAASASVKTAVGGRTRRVPTGVALCVAAGLAVAAGESVLIVYGRWLGADFGLSVAQIGASTLVIVAAELCGEGLVLLVADRLGLCRTLFSALAVSLVAYAMLGAVGARVVLAYVTVGALFIAFEVTVVALVAFASVLSASRADRGRLLGGLMAAVACGNAGGAVMAPAVYAAGGITLAGGVAAAMVASATVVLWVGSRPAAAAGPQ